MARTLTHDRLVELLSYDRISGVFTWNGVPRPGPANCGRAGTISNHGYRVIRVDGRKYRACRLAWFYVHGEWPSGDVDHRNRDRQDDRFDNLRAATEALNSANAGLRKDNTSGFKGVAFHRVTGKWRADCRVRGRSHWLGCFGTAEEAARVYDKAARDRYGEFACLNFPGPGERPARPQGAANTLGADLIQSSQEACVLHGHTMERKHEPSPEIHFDENGKTRDDHVPGRHC
jgi:hypothetical protein